MKSTIKDALLEFVGEKIEPFLSELKFKNQAEITAALQFMADEIESINPDMVFADMIPDAAFSDEEED